MIMRSEIGVFCPFVSSQLDKEESREVTKAEGQAFARAHGCLFLVRLAALLSALPLPPVVIVSDGCVVAGDMLTQ